METLVYISFVYGIPLIVIIIFLCKTIYNVQEYTRGVIQRFGKFHEITLPGLNFKLPFIDKIVGFPSLQIQQSIIEVETKTKDDVFVNIKISIQFHIISDNDDMIYKAHYKLSDRDAQMKSYIYNVVRAEVPKLRLDEVFENKDKIGLSIQNELKEIMDDFGLNIIQTLIVDIDPDAKVKASMNEINAQQRLRIAANEKGEAEKILVIKGAEAQAENKRLQGVGIANQRKAIIDGFKLSVEDFQKSVPSSSPQEIIKLVLMTQYFDTLKDIAEKNAKIIFMSHSPDGMSNLLEQIQAAIISGNEMTEQNIEVSLRSKDKK